MISARTSSRSVRSRRRGAGSIFAVIALGTFIGAMLVAGASIVTPHARAVRVRALRDQATALAESGALVGRRAAARGASGVVVDGVALGPGRLTVSVERADGGARVVSTASVDAGLVAGPDARLTRTVVVTLAGDDARVVRWEAR